MSTTTQKNTDTESENGEIHNATDHAQYTFPSIFIEKHLGVWSVGLDYIPGSVESDEASRTDYNTGGAAWLDWIKGQAR